MAPSYRVVPVFGGTLSLCQRRESSTSIGIQSTPDVEETAIQTQFFVPDMNLRATMSLEKNKHDRIFVERVITPSLMIPSLRRCVTALPGGATIVTGSGQTLYDPVTHLSSSSTSMTTVAAPHRKRTCSMTGVNLDTLSPHAQPIGTLRDELLDFLTPASRKGGGLPPPRNLTLTAMSRTRTLAPVVGR